MDSNNNNISNPKNSLNIKPMNLYNSLNVNPLSDPEKTIIKSSCLICCEEFEIIPEIKVYLSHLLTVHKLVIGNIEQIGDFKK
jgi:hypothetical protein